MSCKQQLAWLLLVCVAAILTVGTAAQAAAQVSGSNSSWLTYMHSGLHHASSYHSDTSTATGSDSGKMQLQEATSMLLSTEASYRCASMAATEQASIRSHHLGDVATVPLCQCKL